MWPHVLFPRAGELVPRPPGRSSMEAGILAGQSDFMSLRLYSDSIRKRQPGGCDRSVDHRFDIPRMGGGARPYVERLYIEHRQCFKAVSAASHLDQAPAAPVAQANRLADTPIAAGQLQPIQAPLDAAEVLGAGDDLLAGVATLAEADAVQEVEVQHLGHESLARGQIYLRKAGANVREPPIM